MFTYKGDSQFSTTFGGIVSIVILSIVGVYLSLLMKTMVYRENSSFNISTEIMNLNADQTEFHLYNDYGFAFGVSLTNYNAEPIELKPEVFTMTVTKGIVDHYPNGTRFLNETEIDIKICDSNDFQGISSDEMDIILNAKAYCPVKKDYAVSGNYASRNYTFIGVHLKKCGLGVGCMEDKDLEKYISETVITLIIVNKYLDFNDYKTPIKSYVDDRYYYYILPSGCKLSRVYLQQNIAILNDDYFGIQSASTHQFINVEKSSVDISGSNEYVTLGIMLGPNKMIYSRNVYTIMDLFGNVGGVYGLLQTICGILVGIISTQIMLASVFRRLYYTDKMNFENLFIKIIDRSKKVANMPVEEVKTRNLIPTSLLNRQDESKSPSCIRIDLSDNSISQRSVTSIPSVISNSDNNFQIQKLTNTLKFRRRYQASCAHKLLAFIPSCICKYNGILKK